MIVLKMYSWELSQADFKKIAQLIQNDYGLFVYFLPLSSDELMGNAAEILISDRLLSP